MPITNYPFKKVGDMALGVKNFLSNFTLHIDYPNQHFSIKRP